MKFLLDMGLAQSTAHFLREQGHDAYICAIKACNG